MTNIAEIFDIKGRFLRSAHLERDFRDPSALYGYILTPGIRDSIERLASGLDPRSGQRAWRITGDYGSGKSSFALLLRIYFQVRQQSCRRQSNVLLRSRDSLLELAYCRYSSQDRANL